MHEFLHILLGHTLRFKKMTPALNVALDAVINAIIDRKLGESFSSMMSEYYADAQGPLRLLRPMTPIEEERRNFLRKQKKPDPLQAREIQHLELHAALIAGKLVSDDILDFVQELAVENLEQLLQQGGLVLLGGHDRDIEPLDALPKALEERVRQAWSALQPNGIWKNDNPTRKELTPSAQTRRIPPEWARSTRRLLQRLLQPDRSARPLAEKATQCQLPVLTPADRRASLRALWNPILPCFDWSESIKVPRESVQIYLDVSGSMEAELPWLVSLLAEFFAWIRLPLWAFSTEVVPAEIRRGKLITKTTGGTEMKCVLEHARQSHTRKALIITDGFVVAPPPQILLPCAMEALVPHDGCSETLQSYGIPVSLLPPKP
jgi:hypothetical protein